MDKAEAAYELGIFNTVDDRIIGLYLVEIKSKVWLERSKVSLCELYDRFINTMWTEQLL